jgi:signal transduction histidine kinase/CheY-like chemotaxis protein
MDDEALRVALDEESREFAVRCDAAGVVRWADARAARRAGIEPGSRLARLAPPGLEGKVEGLLARAARERVRDSELALVVRGRVETFSFRGRPDGEGGALLLATSLPEDQGTALLQVHDAMGEVVSLNREMARAKREIEEQRDRLELANRELDESNRGVRSLHAELAEKADAMRRTSDVKTRVVANVSHEFRTPLHTILGLSRLLLDASDGPLTEEQAKQIRYIRASAEELSGLVTDLLDLSRAESGKVVLHPRTFTVGDLFAALRGMLRPIVPADRPVALLFEADDEALALETDEGKVSQILRNLVSNALKFTERGEVRVKQRRGGEEVLFEVSDTGIGIAPEHHGFVFEEFGQVPGPLQARAKGSGLGLPLSRKLAEILGGTLTLESELGRGSTFTLAVPPVHEEVRELAALQTRPLDPERAPVLVVEDDRRTIFMYERYLSMAGFQVVPARTTDEARGLVKGLRPAAIVLDIMLEGETTWDFLGELKRDPATSDIPVLVVTVTAKEQKARALGADEFWLKPVDQERLLRRLRTLARDGAAAKVLVIDDDERARYLVKKHLAGSSFELVEASDGVAGVQLARDVRPDVILLDFLLEEQTAFDVLDELKADPHTRAIPVIIVTSHVLAPQDRERLAAQTESIVPKESLSRELAINRIRDALRKAGAGVRAPGAA